MAAENHISIDKQTVIVQYHKERYEFPMKDIYKIFLEKRKTYVFVAIRVLLIVLLIPLLVYREIIEPYVIILYAGLLYCFLFFFYNRRNYKLCIFTIDGRKIKIQIRSNEKDYFLGRIDKIAEYQYQCKIAQ